MERILEIFEPELQYLSRFMRMPKEDGMQELRLRLIEIIQEEDL